MKKTKLLVRLIPVLLYFTINKTSIAQSSAFTVGWQKLYGGSNVEQNDYRGHTIAIAPGEGYYFIGDTKSNDGDVSGNHGKGDVWVARIDGSGNILWQKCIGGNQEDYGRFVIATLDSGCLVGGYSFSNNGDLKGNHGGQDAFVIKLSRAGVVEWGRLFGSNKDDGWQDAIQNSDGSYMLAGITNGNNGDVNGNHGGNDAWLVKLNQSGTILWQKCFGGSGDDGDEHDTKIIRCLEGGYMISTVAGSLDGDVTGFHGTPGIDKGDGWLIKLDDNANIQWNKCYGSSNWEYFENINQLPNGDYIASGASHGSGGDIPTTNGNTADWWVVKADQAGNIKWSRIFGGTGPEAVHGKIIPLANGDLIIPSGTRSNDRDCIGTSGVPDLWIVKTDSLGNILSYNLFGGPGYENTSYSVMNADGSLTIAATSDPTDINNPDGEGHDANSQLWILHLIPNSADTFAITTTSLSQISHCTTPSPFSVSVSYTKRGTFKGNNIFTAELSDANGSFASPTVVGSIKTSSSGTINCTIPGNLPQGDHYAIRIRSSTPAYTGITSGHLLSIRSCSLTQVQNHTLPKQESEKESSSLNVFPNPTTSSTAISFFLPQSGNVSLKVYDVSGRLLQTVADKSFTKGEHKVFWNSQNLLAGTYLLRMETTNYSISKKISVIK